MLRDEEYAERGDGHAHKGNKPEHPGPVGELNEDGTDNQAKD